jgi:hypothetical protein
MKRASFLAASATVVAATGGVQASAQSIPGGAHFVERKADFDADAFAKAVGRPAQIRQLWETVAFKPTLWNNIKNSFNGLQFGFGYPAEQIAMVLCPHGPSAAYIYQDAMWQKYKLGQYYPLVDAAGAPVTSNVYVSKKAASDTSVDPDLVTGIYQDTSIAALQERGLIVLACHTAIEEQARAIVKKGFAPAGASASDVAADLLTHLIPGAIVVPSMVATIAVLQQVYRYSYVTLAL